MAYEITLSGAADADATETFALCSVGAWGLFRSWVGGLDWAGYAVLRAFASSGSTEGTDRLAKELLDAEAVDRPDNAGVLATLNRLIEVIGEAGDPDEIVRVTDGVSEEGGPEGNDDGEDSTGPHTDIDEKTA